ncbi:hypothetical protein HDU77_006868 [Chytriomyces hyalinus]|nr:hypothetical protein HDU77_006868 [Chytriomyces hyalinus]
MPVLHAYAHGKACQLQYSGKLIMGGGTFDGEVIERYWAYISNHIGRTQRQTIENRADAIFLMVEHAAVDKNKLFCKSVEKWCKAALDEIIAIKLDAAEASDGHFFIKPYHQVVEANRAFLNQGDTSSSTNLFKSLVENKSPDVFREAENLWLLICNLSIKFEHEKKKSRVGRTSSAKAKASADASQKLMDQITNLIAEFNSLPQKDDVDREIQALAGIQSEGIDRTLHLNTDRADLVVQIARGNPNAVQEQYWRRVEDIYHHCLDLQRGVELYKSKVEEYDAISRSVESVLNGQQRTAALFFINKAKQKAQRSSDECFTAGRMIINDIEVAGLSADVVEVESGFMSGIHQSVKE